MKSIAIILFAILILGIFAPFISAEVKVKFEQNTISANLPTQIRITTSNIENLNGLRISSKPTADEVQKSIEPIGFYFPNQYDEYTIYGSNLVDTKHFGIQLSTCQNVHTKQVIATVQFSSNSSIKIIPNGAASWSEIYNKIGEYGEFELLCTVYASKPEKEWTSNAIVSWKEDGVTKESTIQIENIPTWVTPQFEIKDIQHIHDNDKHISTIEFDLFTDRVGKFAISLNNTVSRPIISEEQLWCQSGDDKQFVPVFTYSSSNTRVIWVTKVPSDNKPIQCSFQYDTIERSDDKQDIYLLGTIGEFYPLEIKLDIPEQEYAIQSYFYPTVQRAKKDNLWINIQINGGSAPETVFDEKATITIIFSKHVNFDTLNKTSSLCGKAFGVVGQTITILDHEKHAFSCDLFFTGDNAFHYETFKGATVTVEVRDTSLNHLITRQPIAPLKVYPNPTLSIDVKTQIAQDNDIIITDEFEIIDDKNWAVPLVNGITLVFGISQAGSLAISNEDFPTHLKCNWTDGEKLSIPLKYDQQTMSWSSTIKTIGTIDQIEYNHKFKCIRTYPKLTKYGLIFTPDTLLDATVLVMECSVYRNKPIIRYSQDIVIGQPTERPEGASLPEPLITSYKTSMQTFIPTKEQITFNSLTTLVNQYKEQSYSIIEKSINDGTINTISNGFWSMAIIGEGSAIEYVNFDAGTKFQTFIDQEVKATPGKDGIVLGNVSTLPLTKEKTPYNTRISFVTQFELSTKDQPKINNKTLQTYLPIENNNESLIPISHSTSVYNGIQTQLFYGTPITGCGMINGLQLTGDEHGLEIKEWKDILAQVSTYKTRTLLCRIGESCTYNGDCVQPFHGFGLAVCEQQKCTFKGIQATKWNAFNNANSISIIGTIMVVIIGIFFF